MNHRKVVSSRHLIWTDWRGNEYTVGDTVLYARMHGRSCEMAEGVVTDLFEVYYDRVGRTYKWIKLAPGELAPFETVYKYVHKVTGEISPYNHRHSPDAEEWESKQVTLRMETERRAHIMPTGNTSRFNSYRDRERKFEYDPVAGTGYHRDLTPEEKAKLKPVRLSVTESITLPWP